MWLYMLKANSRQILLAIAARCPVGQPTPLRIGDIAQSAHVSGRTVRRHIRRLDAWGYICLNLPSNGCAYVFQVQQKAREELNLN